MILKPLSSKKEQWTAGELAKVAQVNIQTIRFYDKEGVLKPVSRTEARYRIYDEESLRRLQFIFQAKELGFSLKEIKGLLNLRVSSDQSCDCVRSKAEDKLTEIKRKISRLKKMEAVLKALVSDCENRVLSDKCPILTQMEFGDE